MITLLKLGGSLITNKKVERSFREATVKRLAQEIKHALNTNPDLRLIIGHGSGSFGHFEATRHDTIQGVSSASDWRGFAQVATIAAELNYLVTKTLSDADIPVFRVQPSASVRAENGIITDMTLHPIEKALENGLIPLIYGDVAMDDRRGGTITSTETLFTYLVKKMPVNQLLLPGEVDGVFDSKSQIIPGITLDNFKEIESALQGAAGVDVTGGMYSKVRDMLVLTRLKPEIQICIFNGIVPGRVQKALLREDIPGTMIHS